jgi:hypothetical protein
MVDGSLPANGASTTSPVGVTPGDLLQVPDKAMDHAWRYFALHAQQRMSVFNFFVILSGILATGIGAGLQAGKPMVPMVAILGALLALFSLVFYRLDARASELVKLAERALIDCENISMPTYAQILSMEQTRGEAAGIAPSTWTFGKSFRIIFRVLGTAGLVASAYAVYRLMT